MPCCIADHALVYPTLRSQIIKPTKPGFVANWQPILIAHPRPNKELGRESHTKQIQLPSFSHFLSGVGQLDLTLSPLNWSPTSGSDLSDEPSRFALPPHRDHLQPRLLHHSTSFHKVSHKYHFVDVRPKEHLHPRGLSEPPRDDRNTKPNIASPVYLSPEDLSFSQSWSSNTIVVTEANIEGKSLYYVNNDGSQCQNVISGDTINPNWAIVKAEELRKRFGKAFNINREKAIQCDSQGPKYAQYQEFGGGGCKLKSSNIHSQHSLQKDSASNIESPDEPCQELTGSSTPTEALTNRTSSRASTRGSINIGRILSPSSTVGAIHSSGQSPSKKSKLSSSSRHNARSPSDSVTKVESDAMEGRANAVLDVTFAFDKDPSLVDNRWTILYIKEYFKYINSHVCSLFPKKTFLR